MKSRYRVCRNTRAGQPGAYRFQNTLSLTAAGAAFADISQCPLYRATPLLDLASIARSAGVRHVYYKDESSRFGLGSFKALGGAYAVSQILLRHVSETVGRQVSVRDLARGKHRNVTRNITVACATDGNHGRSVAAGAQVFGCNCVIFLHAGVSKARERAIADFGARVVRIAGTYDDSVRQVAQAAEAEGWKLVSDTSWRGYESIPSLVMQGYSVIVREISQQLAEQGAAMPTHVFIQAGVGGLAAAVVAYFWESSTSGHMPTFIVVEPDKAACLFESAVAGERRAVDGDLQTAMAGLSCGEPSLIAWPLLYAAVDYFVTIPDEFALNAMRLLASSEHRIVAGESATAGLAALLAIANDPETQLREEMRLDRSANVLLLGTEGATDPELYQQLVAAGTT